MSIRPAEIMKFRRVPMGRLVFALTEVARRAQALGLGDIAAHAERGATHGREVMNALMRRAADFGGRYGPEANALDSLLDGVLVGLDGYLASQERAYRDEARGQAAANLRLALLPGGVGAIAKLPFARQHTQVEVLLARAAEPDLAEDVALLPDLAPLLARMATLNQRYGEALRDPHDVPTPADIEAGRARGRDLLAETAALILGHFAIQPPDDPDGRDHLLAPILDQLEAVRRARRRRQVADIDPDTGEDLPADDLPDGELPDEPDGELPEDELPDQPSGDLPAGDEPGDEPAGDPPAPARAEPAA